MKKESQGNHSANKGNINTKPQYTIKTCLGNSKEEIQPYIGTLWVENLLITIILTFREQNVINTFHGIFTCSCTWTSIIYVYASTWL